MEKQKLEEQLTQFKEAVSSASCLLIGVGDEWAAGEKRSREELAEAYQALYSLTEGKDYFIITTVTDGLIRESAPDQGRITAPCGNEQWQQCSRACTRDIWEPGEIPDGLCPHCGAPLTGNTILQRPTLRRDICLSGRLTRNGWEGL